MHCVKSVRIRIFSGLYFPTFRLNEYEDLLRKSPFSVQMRENTYQKNSEYGHFLRSDSFMTLKFFLSIINIKYEIILRTMDPYVDKWVHYVQKDFICSHIIMGSILSYSIEYEIM